jgi:Ca-activated chloride channel homolog
MKMLSVKTIKAGCHLTGFLSVAIVFALLNIHSSAAQILFSTQPEKQETRSGNKEYQKENYTDAETNYKKALDIRNNMPEATFNLGDAVYKQKRYEDAQKQFQLSAQTNSDPAVKAKAYHNLGNSFLEQKKWEDAIKAYKSALKINPGDQETKYNLAYANAMLQKNGGGGQKNQKQDQKDQQDKKDQQKQDQKNQSDQNKDQQQKQQQDQQANNQDQKKQQQQQQGQKPKLSKEDAEKLLAAMENEEQQTTQKMQKKTMKAVKVKIKKDW